MSSILADRLQQHPFTKGFWPDHVNRLAALGSEVHFAPGETIFEEGDPSSLFYLIVNGNIALEVRSPGRPVRIATLYAGEVLGWSSITGDTGKQFQARALEEVEAIAFDGVRLRHACEADYAFGFRLMKSILEVTSERLHAIRAQLLDLYTPVGAEK